MPDSTSPLYQFLSEAKECTDPTDPSQGVVALRTVEGVYYGHVGFADSESVSLHVVSKDGKQAPYPVMVMLRYVVSVRYADLNESPYTGFARTNGPV